MAEDDTKTINRRQEQLGITRCDFPELLRLKEDVKPAVQLWDAITEFNLVIDDWRSLPVSLLSIETIEESCAEWYRKLVYVQRNETLKKLEGPMTFVNFILLQIDTLKEFFPLLQCLRAKGLEARHIWQINKELQSELNLNVNFRWLAKRDLHKGKKLEKIK